MSGAHVHLQRRQNQMRHVEGGVAFLAHFDEIILAFARANVNIVRLLLTHTGLEFHLAPTGLIVMAHVKSYFVRQRQHAHDGSVKRTGITARKICPRGAGIRHEKRIPHKARVAENVGHASRCVTRSMDGMTDHVAYAV